MGYTFRIGNAVPEFNKDVEYGELSARWVVEGETHPDAPTFPNDNMTGNSNSRSPSYSAWHDFCEHAGIFDVFYDERGHLRAGHPGCEMIMREQYEKVALALEQYRRQASKPPGFSGMPKFDPATKQWKSPDEGIYDSTLARLIWLEWWMKWALENCETPAIENT